MTTHSDPTYVVHDVVHYAVGNMPGAVPNTSTYALTNVTLPYALAIAERGLEDALRADPALARGAEHVRRPVDERARGRGARPGGRGSWRPSIPGLSERPARWRRSRGRARAPAPTSAFDAPGRAVPGPPDRRTRAVAQHAGGVPARPARSTAEYLANAGSATPRRSTRPTWPGSSNGSRRTEFDEGAGTGPSSVARSLAAVRMLHAFLLREGDTDANPAAGVRRPKVPQTLPRPLSVDRSRRSWRRPATGDPVGLRDRAILETLYGGGPADLGAGRPGRRRHRPGGGERARPGQGQQGAEVPLGRFAVEAVGVVPDAEPAVARPAAVRAGAVPQPARRPPDAAGRDARPAGGRPAGRRRHAGHPAHAAALVRDAPAGGGRRRPRGAGAARPRVAHHDADLHAGDGRPAPRGVLHRASAGPPRRQAANGRER